MYKRGLVVGKFYPPHRGHKYLIDTAAANVEHLTVIVCNKPEHNPTGELRGAWLRETHPGVEVMVIEDTLDADDSRLWAENCIHWLGGAPDVVFTSEDYGEPFAYYLGCKHIQVDKARQVVPCSGTMIRENPFKYWDFIEPCVRAYYARRVCLVGAESTGKTTLAQALATHFKTVWVPEYGREYSEIKLAEEGGYNWSDAEFTHIAQEQCRREDAAAREANQVLICDTDAFATSIWYRRYMGKRSPEVEAIAAPRHYDLYLLPDINTPFEQDGTRDGEKIRHWMQQVFVEELQAQGKPYIEVSGAPEERLAQAVEAIEALLVPR